MAANTRTTAELVVLPGQQFKQISMSTTTATKTAPAKKAPAKAEKKPAEKKVYTATGRSGQETTRSSATAVTHAVDVKRDGKANYQAGVVVKFFATESAAMAFADAVNNGEMAKKSDWYETAREAIVVPATEVK